LKVNGKHSNGKIAIPAAEKRTEAINLRRQGFGFQQIAEAIGFANSGAAFKAVRQGLKEALREAGSEELRTLECDRLDELQRSRWEKAVGGDDAALDRVLKIMTRRAELLGLDAPQKHQIELGKVYDVINSPEDL